MVAIVIEVYNVITTYRPWDFQHGERYNYRGGVFGVSPGVLKGGPGMVVWESQKHHHVFIPRYKSTTILVYLTISVP